MGAGFCQGQADTAADTAAGTGYQCYPFLQTGGPACYLLRHLQFFFSITRYDSEGYFFFQIEPFAGQFLGVANTRYLKRNTV
jgi:hypothetical protein